MAHLGDKLAEYFYEELSSAEMTEARKHVEACIECRLDLERFERVHLALRTAPELEPPRHVVFSPRERRSWLSWLEWRTAATAGAAAALVAGILMGFSHQADRAWLAEELNKRDAEIQRLQAELGDDEAKGHDGDSRPHPRQESAHVRHVVPHLVGMGSARRTPPELR